MPIRHIITPRTDKGSHPYNGVVEVMVEAGLVAPDGAAGKRASTLAAT